MFNLEKLLGVNNSKIFELKKAELFQKFEPQFINKEYTEIRIFYHKENNKNVDLFLFNNKSSKEQFVSTRTLIKEETEKFKIITDLVDQNFLSVINMIQLFDLKQTHIVESEIYRIGDFTIEFSKMYMETDKNKIKFIFCLNNSYGHSFEDTFDFVKEVMGNLFENVDETKIVDSCRVNDDLLKKYFLINKEPKQEEDHLNNIISEKFPQIKLIQYIEFLFDF